MRSFLDEVRYEEGGRRLTLTMHRASGEEKRHAARLPVHQPLRVAPILPDGTVDWNAAYEAVSRNFSADGVALLQQGLAHTQRVLIGICAGNQPVYIPAEIRHCRSLAGNLIELGCRFQNSQSSPCSAEAATPDAQSCAEPLERVHQAVADLLEEYQTPQLNLDRRAHPRIVFTDRIEVLLSSAAEPIIGYARDLSKGGIAFITTAPVALEAATVFLPRRGGPRLGVRAQVLRCNKIKDGLYDIGARFLELT
jgi:hypothetical protein